MKTRLIDKWKSFSDREKLGIYAFLMLVFYCIEDRIKYPFGGGEHSYIVYIGFVVYGFFLFTFFSYFRKYRQQELIGVIPVILMLFCIGLIVCDIVYLSTPHPTFEQIFELEYGPLPKK